jgi:AcrR family transcriptional regulator
MRLAVDQRSTSEVDLPKKLCHPDAVGTAARRERERHELRGKILDAARELFVTHGYDAVTMRKIAEKIEYSTTAIYVHFEDKDALLRELCRVDMAQLAEEFVKIGAVADPMERLRKAGYAYVNFGIEHPNHYRLMFMTPRPATTDPNETSPQKDSYAFVRWTVEEAIQARLLIPSATDADLVSQTVWAAMHGVVALHIVRFCGENSPGVTPAHDGIDWRPVKQITKLLVDALITGLTR